MEIKVVTPPNLFIILHIVHAVSVLHDVTRTYPECCVLILTGLSFLLSSLQFLLNIISIVNIGEIEHGLMSFFIWWRSFKLGLILLIHDDVIKWKHFPRYWSCVRGIHRSPAQRLATRSFDVFFDLRLNNQEGRRWFETPSCSLWRHCNGLHAAEGWYCVTHDWSNIGHFLIELAYVMTSSNINIFRVTGPLCGEFTGPGEFPTQRPVTRSFDVFFDLRLNKRLNKQPWGWWLETPSWSLWRQCNEYGRSVPHHPGR